MDFARQLSTRTNIRIIEIVSTDGRERYTGPEEAWLFWQRP
jgi:hypothetical protein